MIRVWNGNEGRQMENDIASFYGLPDTVRVANITGKDFKAFFDISLSVI